MDNNINQSTSSVEESNLVTISKSDYDFLKQQIGELYIELSYITEKYQNDIQSLNMLNNDLLKKIERQKEKISILKNNLQSCCDSPNPEQVPSSSTQSSNQGLVFSQEPEDLIHDKNAVWESDKVKKAREDYVKKMQDANNTTKKAFNAALTDQEKIDLYNQHMNNLDPSFPVKTETGTDEDGKHYIATYQKLGE